MSDPVEVIAKTIYDRLHGIGIPIRDHVSLGIAKAALSALEGEGLAVVPVVPTDRMLTAGERVDEWCAAEVWRDMIEARSR